MTSLRQHVRNAWFTESPERLLEAYRDRLEQSKYHEAGYFRELLSEALDELESTA